jgi:hypothetical protein
MQRKRRDRLEAALASLEAEFRTRLIVALKRCEQGSWGLFAQNFQLDIPEGMKQQAYVSSGAQGLDALGSEIAQIREELGIPEPYALYAQFSEKRGYKGENCLGEGRLAAAWLEELNT